MTRVWAPLLALLWALALGGCANLLPPGEASDARAAPFDVLGRVFVRYGDRALTANVRWQHARESDDIWLMTPTGQALAYLREDHEGATFTGADQVQYRATRVESLTRQAMGWELPVSRLQFWLRGAAAPGASAQVIERDSDGRTRRMMQDGWQVTYDYYPAGQNNGLPRRMELASTGQTLRLVIDTWRTEAAEGP
jgi:outer membrane lipoprotein LolB